MKRRVLLGAAFAALMPAAALAAIEDAAARARGRWFVRQLERIAESGGGEMRAPPGVYRLPRNARVDLRGAVVRNFEMKNCTFVGAGTITITGGRFVRFGGGNLDGLEFDFS